MAAELAKKTVKVLRGVAAHPSGVGLSELARETGIPKATCLRILSVLQEERVVLLGSDTKRYSVSIGALAFAAPLLDPENGYLHLQAELEDLSSRVQETCGLDVLSGRDVMVLMQVKGPLLISQSHTHVPRLLPTWRTSTGKVLLAHLSESKLRGHTGGADLPRDLDDLLDELAEIRQRGYGYSYEDLEPFLAAVAAPVRSHDDVVAAVWVGGPTFRVTRERIAELAVDVEASAARLSRLVTDTGAALALSPSGPSG